MDGSVRIVSTKLLADKVEANPNLFSMLPCNSTWNVDVIGHTVLTVKTTVLAILAMTTMTFTDVK